MLTNIQRYFRYYLALALAALLALGTRLAPAAALPGAPAAGGAPENFNVAGK
ncbi:hypothetical protein [Hymenobacter sp. PAMC 26628]|uniref:hypothetical protein n=1 Tax=Hymenobacter sp. PAMC 26628 TaxID=1484118 RepID=UPI000A53C903|nr:hypothetical protein [Hymenobacter sp. PAMC 26628]